MTRPFVSGPDIILALVEELGEVSTEIALIEQIGTKVDWQREASREKLAEEMSHVLNLLIGLANHYGIDLDVLYADKI